MTLNIFQNIYLIDYIFLSIPKIIYFIKKNENFFFLEINKFSILIISYYLFYCFNIKAKQLIDLTSVDYILNKKRFNLIYNYLSNQLNLRYIVSFFIEEIENVNSLIYIYPNISWYEREVWDLFGIFFLNNKFLKKILLDYGFLGHPLRKDFPLTGYIELVHSTILNSILLKKLNLTQHFRAYDTESVWFLYNKII
jgi:NADH:ubiquinone oxidoreductase subunit C